MIAKITIYVLIMSKTSLGMSLWTNITINDSTSDMDDKLKGMPQMPSVFHEVMSWQNNSSLSQSHNIPNNSVTESPRVKLEGYNIVPLFGLDAAVVPALLLVPVPLPPLKAEVAAGGGVAPGVAPVSYKLNPQSS
jgi:hypothetical protein